MKALPCPLRRPLLPAVLAAAVLLATPACPWGAGGHRLINRLAVTHLPEAVPAFLSAPAALEQIEYLAPEPDNWRGQPYPALTSATAPDHFLDLEYAALLPAPLPRTRGDYVALLYAQGILHRRLAAQMRIEEVGALPYAMDETYERLVGAFRQYRQLAAAGASARPAESAAIFYTGWLGHYAGDGSQPLHLSRDYDGWIEAENPHGYSTAHGIHAYFETTFVNANVHAEDVAPLLGTPRTLKGNVFDGCMEFLARTGTHVEQVYQLQKTGAFDGPGSPEARRFTAERLAAGAAMLRDLVYTAWLESATPVAEWHAPAYKPAAAPRQQTPGP